MDVHELLLKVQNKEMDLNTAEEYLMKLPYEDLGFAVQKGNAELLEKINAGLANVKENGTYDELLKKWGLA